MSRMHLFTWSLSLLLVSATWLKGDDPVSPTDAPSKNDSTAPAGTAPAAEESSPPSTPSLIGNWPYWRGPQMNGTSTEKNLPDSWDPDGGEGSNLVWKRDDLGAISTPVVYNGKLYLITRDKPFTPEEREKLVCLDAATGETIWENKWNIFLTDVPDTRVGWSSPVVDPETGNVYCLGVCGYFQCVNGQTGETIWSRSLSEQFGLLTTYGGRTNFPIVHEDNVIISGIIIGWGEQAKPCHRFIAFDKYNGLPAWFEGTRPLPYDTTYSAPIMGTIDGQALMFFGSGDGGVHAFQPRTGKWVWKYNVSERGINTSPLLFQGKIFGGHNEENIGSTKMGALFALNAKDGSEQWKQLEKFVGKSPIITDGKHVIACEVKGTLFVVDPETGRILNEQRRGRPGHKVDTVMTNSPLYADGKLYVFSANGRWWIFRLKESGEGDDRKVDLEVIHKLRLSGEGGSGSPIAAGGRIYLPTTGALYCIGKPEAALEADPLPEPPAETPVAKDQTPARVQVVPCEQLLMPGDRQRFDVRLYNANGQWLRNADPSEVTFSVDGLGEIDPSGAYSTSPDLRKQGAAIITAKIGEISGTARVRIMPNLPLSVDFDNGEISVNWIGIRYRHVPLEYDLYQSLTEKEAQAGQLYIYLHSTFVNSGAPALTINDATPRRSWTALLRYLRLLDEGVKPKTVEEGRAKLDSSLQLLVEAGVLKSFDWSTWDRDAGDGKTVPEPQLKVVKGDRQPEGNGVMCKISTIPKGARSQGWMGHTEFHDYTIQADVMGLTKDGKMPDIGLINSRYTLDLQGEMQKLQIRTWTPQLYMAQTVDFAWEPNVWYTLKFQSERAEGKTILRGKVWKRGEEEPAEWTVTAEDSDGNVEGSPGTFGNAKDAEIFYDNISITPNLSSSGTNEEKTTGQ